MLVVKLTSYAFLPGTVLPFFFCETESLIKNTVSTLINFYLLCTQVQSLCKAFLKDFSIFYLVEYYKSLLLEYRSSNL